jgi:dTDP-glucose 4,6-dehydratase
MKPDTGPTREGASKDDIHLPTNIGNPSEFTVLDLAEKVLKLTSSDSLIENKPLPIDDPRVRQPDITRARQVLDWEPVVSLDEGLDKTVKYFRSII